MKAVCVTSISPFPQNSGGSLRSFGIWSALTRLGEAHLVLITSDAAAKRSTAECLDGSRFTILEMENRSGLVPEMIRYAKALRDRSYYEESIGNAEEVAKVVEVIEKQEPDLILLGSLTLSPLVPVLKERFKEAKIFLDGDNVWPILFRRFSEATSNLLKKLQYCVLRRSMERLEEKYLHRVDVLFATSIHDASYYVKTLGLGNVEVLPNVIDMSRYQWDDSEEAGAIVFSAWFRYRPNSEAACELIEHSRQLHRDGVEHHLYLVGRDASADMRHGAEGCRFITITGEVPDVRPYIQKASVAAAPLRTGSGTKLKVIEALALGRPVLTTTVGAEGLDFRNHVEAMVVDDRGAFRDALKSLLADSELWRRLGRAGRAWVEENHSIERLGAILAGLLEDELERARPPS